MKVIVRSDKVSVYEILLKPRKGLEYSSWIECNIPEDIVDRYNTALSEVYELQDEIMEAIVNG